MKNKFLTWAMVGVLSFGLAITVSAEELTPPTGEMGKNLPWIDLTLPYTMTLQELAGMYYSDENDYTIIYDANRDVVPKTLQVEKGMLIKIPVTEKFEDQPLILGWN
jgi:hypothetical protein